MKKSPHLLIVDDCNDLIALLKLALEAEGFKVSSAENGVNALEFLTTTHHLPELILLDLMMPGMDGFDFRKKLLAAKPECARIPVIVMTGNSEPALVEMLQPIAGYLEKPMDLQDLISTIRSHLDTTLQA